nr:PD40 domain-containing protein [Pyrinomonadaceae bacterium]
TRDGYAKILDFGLAKLVEPQNSSNAPNDSLAEADTEMMPQHTQPGMVMGTISYMSPEQAQGKAIDPRSDIFSFGCILYEITTGRRPFDGDSVIDTLHRIIYSPAPPLREFNASAPVELQRIVRKCLAKDPEERYQSIKDAAIDLKELRRELENDLGQQRFSQPAAIAQASSAAADDAAAQSAIATVHQPALRTIETDAPYPASSVAEQVAGESRVPTRHSFALLIAGTIIAVVALAAFGLYKFLGRSKSDASFQSMQITRLTATGTSTDAAISPDGKYVVHIVNDGGKQSLWGRQIATSSNVQIIQPAEVQYQGLTFSPDGNYVYYIASDESNPIGALYQVPALGGTPRKLIANVDRSVTLSPDGTRIAFISRDLSDEQSLVIADTNGNVVKKLAARRYPDFLLELAWSPDGEVIACVVGSYAGGFYMNVVAVAVKDGKEKAVGSRKWWSIGRPAWLRDGSGLVMTAMEQAPGMPKQILQLDYPTGETRRISNDLNSYMGVSLTSDSHALVTVQSEQISNVWVAPIRSGDQAKPITTGKYDRVGGISWTPDGKIIYASNASGSWDIWGMEADGSNPRQLTSNARSNLDPAVSPDGRHVVFGSNRSGAFNIWRMDIDGLNPKQLTGGGSDWWATCSPDGRWVIYTSSSSGKFTLWKVPIDGGEAVQLTDYFSELPSVSPDGKLIACSYWNEAEKYLIKIATIPFEGGRPTKVFESPYNDLQVVRWTSDGRALTYWDNRGGVSNIWSLPLDGSQPTQLTNFKEERIFSYGWSRDGKQLAASRGVINNNVVLITDYK